MKTGPVLMAVCGVKNSGKTTLITRLLPLLCERGLKVATIKHDGHDFEPDVPGTDSWRHRKAGACGTAVFSGKRWMVVHERAPAGTKELVQCFPEADLVLLEGFKNSRYPKVEVIRQGNSGESVCDPENLLAVATDLKEDRVRPGLPENVQVLDLNDTEKIAEVILPFCQSAGKKSAQ